MEQVRQFKLSDFGGTRITARSCRFYRGSFLHAIHSIWAQGTLWTVNILE